MLQVIIFCLIWHQILAVTTHSTYPEDTSTWVGLTRTKKILGLTQLPKDEYFQGGLLEIVEDNFGPALYFRSSLESEEYTLAIPLPFSICSLTYLNGNFYVIRDDDDDVSTTLYTISDYNLIGGYLYWREKVEEQCDECSNDEIPSSYFDLNNFTSICSGSTSNYICSVDLDTLFMKERLSWKNNDLSVANAKYQNLINKFATVYDLKNLIQKAWLWKEWKPYGSSPNRFTSVHGLFLKDVLLVQRPNFIPMVIENFEEPPKPLIVKPKPIRFITLSSFEIGGETYLIGDDVDRKTTIVNYKRGIKFKVGEMLKTFRKIFAVGSSTMIGQSISYDLFSSDDYLPDFIFPLVLCGDSGVPSSDGCLHSYDVKTPFTTSFAETRCEDDSAKYKEGIDLSSNEVKATDRRWIIHDNHHSYYMGNRNEKLTYNAAFAQCKRFSSDTDVAHLAELRGDDLRSLLLSGTNYLSSRLDGVWLGGKTKKLKDDTETLLWLQGKPVDIDEEDNEEVALGGIAFAASTSPPTAAHHTEKCLFAINSATNNVTFNTSSCFTQRSYICEKYRVCWDIFPNATIDFEDLLISPDDESLSVVISLGKVDSSSPDPVKTCSKLCQQRITDGCSAFTYFEEGNGPWSGLCFGRSQYNFDSNSMTASLLRHSGVLRQCQGGSAAQAKTKQLSYSVNSADCSTTAHITDNAKEVISLHCPSGCAAANSQKVYGDQIYQHASSVCRAAIHAGVIDDSGGMVTIHRRIRYHTEPGSTRNGVTSESKTSSSHFVFDPTLSISFGPCAFTYSMFVRSCAPVGTSDIDCMNRGCCSGYTKDPYNRDCIHKHLSGYLYTDDGWLKSPYSSYEYVVIYIATKKTMDDARKECQKYGEDLAYAGIMEEDSYIVKLLHLNVEQREVNHRKLGMHFYISGHPKGKCNRVYALSPVRFIPPHPDLDKLLTQLGGDLLLDNTDLLVRHINDNILQTPHTDNRKHTDSIWIGLFDSDEDEVYAGLNGKQGRFVDWAPGEPNIVEEKHIYDNILHNLQTDNRKSTDHIWIGIVQDGDTEINVGLNQKPATRVGWRYNEPSSTNEKCVQFHQVVQELVDVSCSGTVHRALCQRKSYRCDVTVASRQPCSIRVGFNASKAECLAQGCCYVEPLDGNDMCFRSVPKEHMRNVSWERPAPNNYEYALVQTNGNYEKARIDCLDRGGQLAYEGFNDEDTYGLIRDKLLSPNFALDAAWFGANDLEEFRNYTTLSGEQLRLNNWALGEPKALSSSCLRINLQTGLWLDTLCTAIFDVYAVCQRPEQLYSSSEGKISCETDGFGLCETYNYTCHEYATCVDHQDWFQCVCDNGYTGDGEDCELFENCPSGWILEGSSCYLLKVTVASFFEAESQCQEMGAHLVSIDSDEEYQIFKELVLTEYGTNVLFWIGLRWTIPWVSRNGEEYGTCGIWTDGTDCEYNQFVGTRGHECFAYDGSSWINQMCALSLPAASGRSEGFVCEISAGASQFLEVSMTSYSRHTYPGLAQIKVNGKDVLNFNNDTDTSANEKGCLYIVTLSNDGKVVNTYSFYNNESLQFNKDLADEMLKEFMKNNKETYFALATAGRIVYELAEYLYIKMRPLGIPMKAILTAKPPQTVQASEEDFVETELSSEHVIFKCNSCHDTCDGVALFKDANGLTTCRSYLNEGTTSNYQVSIASSSNGKYVVAYRSKVIKTPTTESKLFCPWMTDDFSTFGIKLTNIVEDKEKRMSTVDCMEPPCVHQMACRLPEMISKSGAYTNPFTEMFMMLCKRIKLFVYTCYENVRGGFSRRPYRVSAKVPITRAPMLATFDDLLHLGSPPFEFGSVYGLYNITWRPMLWTWKNDKHALLVPGVRSRAIRFDGEKVQSPNDLCWWNLGDNATCPHGITMAFWFKVVEWPDTDQPFINTGAVGALGACKGVVVFITRRNSIMIRVVAEEDVFQIEISVEFRKWTHIWFSWNRLEKKLQIYFDWELKSDTSSRERTLPSISLTCDHSKLSIGSTSGAFDIDDFLIFSHAVENAYELNILLPESTLPLRHRFIEEKSETLPSSKHLGGETCPASEKYYACGDFKSDCPVSPPSCPFSVSCLGSVPFCIRGFSVAFSLKFHTTTNTLRVMLISNLPSKAQNDSYARDNPSYGFQVEATKQPNKKYLVFLWHTMQDDPVPQPRLEFLVDSEEPATFWLQYHPDGMWFFCYRWPNNCLKQASKDIASVDEAFSSEETYTKLAIGPNIIMQDSTMSSVRDFIDIYNLWFIEEAFDLVMLADETRMLSSPIRWIPEHLEFTSARDEIPFEKKGDISKVSFSVDDFYVWQVNIENPEGSVTTGLDAGYKLETLVGWMEIDQDTISNDCLFDIDKCQNGFTFQVWIKTSDCMELVSGENACYYVSTGGQSTPLSRGFAIFRTADDGIYHVIVSTSTKIWKLDFEADFSSYYTLLRISWHLNIGLSLFLNDIPVKRSILTQQVIEPDVEDIDAYRKFKPFTTLTIGRRDDLMQGFSTFHLGEMFFWDGLVEGFPSQSIGRRCLKPWHQIGESCYSVTSAGGTQAQAETICRSMKSELAHVPSFSTYQGLKRYLLTQSSSLEKLRMGLVADSWPSWENLQWKYLGLPVNTLNFNAIASMGWDASTQSSVFALSRSSTGYGRVEFNFVNPISMAADGFVCAMPLSQDYFHRSCYTPEMEANKFGFDDSSGLALHNVSGQVSSNVVNSLGSYDIPNSCRRLCYLEHGYLVAVIRNYKCYCLDKTATMNDFISQSSSIVDKNSCSAFTKFYIAEKFEFGFSTLNSQPETLRYRKPSRNGNCGPFENGGVYKCGTEERAAFYGFHENFAIKDYSLSPIKTVDIFTGFESQKTITLVTHEELTIRTRNYECEEKESQQDSTDKTCINSTVTLSIDFGDGSVYENNMPLSEAESFTFLHFYNTSGNFVFSINIKNSIIKSFNWKKDITVTPRPESVELSHIEMVVTKPDEMAEFTTEALQGTNFKCSWEYNDGSPEEEASFQNIPIAKKFHRFKSSGVYTVQAHCWNALSSRTVESLTVVHQPIIGLSAIDDVVVSYGDEYMHTWEILQGSHVSCDVFIGSHSVKELSVKPESGGEVSFFYDSDINQGYALFPCPQNEDQCFLPEKVTSYVVVVVCYNAMTDPSPVAVTYITVEKPIQTLNTNISEEVTFLEPRQTFCASITVVGGSNVIIVVDKDDDTIPPDDVFDYCGEEECDDRTFCLSYQEPMKHTLEVKAFNSLGIEEKVITISVMLPILKVVVDLIPATQPHKQSEIILSHDPPLPTGEVQVDYGDGITEYVELLFNKISSKMSLFHSYSKTGYYNITFHINNNVSSFIFEKQIRIGIPVEDVELKVASKRHVRSQLEPVIFLVRTSRGSEPKYRIDFGDDAKPSGLKPSSLHFIESSSRKDPEIPDIHYIEHIYDHPGNYVASVYVENLFGNTQAVCTETVVVQNPLTESKYQLKENELLPVAIPTGTASFNAHLVQSNAFDLLPHEVDLVGWANDVHILWIQDLPSEKVVLHQSFGIHDTDLFPENITFIESDVGDVSVYARLWNLVSEVELHFPFKLVERIDGIQVEVRNIENIGVIEDLDGRFVDVSTLHELTFRLTISKGSHVTYFFDFGDGSSDTKESPLLLGKGVFVEFTHSYKANGTYAINVTVSNDVGSHSRSYVDAVRVYDKVSGLKELIETVDFDEQISGIDILKESSEFYALAYGEPGHQSGDDQLVFPSNRPIHFRVGVEVGSNVSISWTFINYNVTIHISDTAKQTAFNSQTDTEYVIEDNMISIEDLQIKFLERPSETDLRYLTEEQIAKLDNYRTESALLLRFSKPCEEVVKIEISNPISYTFVLKEFNLKTVVEGVSFENFEPPIVNKTSNISLTVNQVGSETCFVLDPGDLTYEVAFGFDSMSCVGKRTIKPDMFYELNEDISRYKAAEFSFFSFVGNPTQGLAQLNFTLSHVYSNMQLYKVKLLAFNLLSSLEISRDVTVTEILCDFPHVSIEKPNGNSLMSPRKVLSFIELRLYTLIRTNCKITSLTDIQWRAYEVKEVDISLFRVEKNTEEDGYGKLPSPASKFASVRHSYREIPGLVYTSNSEDITIKPRFLKLGMHLVCVNVAMVDVVGINTTDCVYIQSILPPLVAGIALGIRRAVGFGSLISMDAASASYDPDRQTLEDVQDSTTRDISNLQFKMSCPFVVFNNSADQESQDEKILMFSDINDWNTATYGYDEFISTNCTNSFHAIEFGAASLISSSETILNATSGSSIHNLERLPCFGVNKCHMTVEQWLADYFFDIGYNSSSENVTYSIKITMRCRVPDSNKRFEYFQSNNSCTTFGYYPTNQNNLNVVCSAVTSRAFPQCGGIEIDTSRLKPNLSYMVRVLLTDTNSTRFAIGSQVIQFTSKPPPEIKIQCLVNCDIKVNPRAAISVEAKAINETSSITYEWTLLEVLHKTRRRRDLDDNVDLYPVEGFEQFSSVGIHDNYFVIEPGLLLPSVQYRIRVTGTVVGAFPGLTEIELSLNLPPYNGDCTIDPKEGTAVNDTFTVSCPGWKDEGINVDRKTYLSPNEYSLSYQVYYRREENGLNSLLLYGSEFTLSGLFLPPGLSKNDFRIWIQVRVIDEYGAQAVVNLTATVYGDMEVSDEMLRNVSSIEIATSSAQNVAQLSASVSEILNEKANTSAKLSSKSSEKIQAEVQERASLRGDLVNAVVEKINKDGDIDGIMQACSTLNSLTTVPDEVSSDTQVVAADALSERASLLSKLSESRPAVDVEETANVMVVGLENVVKSAQTQMLANLDEADDSTSLVKRPIFSEQTPPIISSKIILDEEEEYLSPEERQERRTVHSKSKSEQRLKNSNQTKEIGMKAITSMNSLSGSLLRKKVPGEPAVVLRSKGINMQVQKNKAADICRALTQNITSNSTPSALTSILLNSNVNMGDCNSTSDEEAIETELTTLDDNPFVWDGSADFVRSSVVSLTFKFQNGTKPFQGENNTFRLELPVNPTLSSVAPQFFEFKPSSGSENMSFHELSVAQLDSVTFLTINPHNASESSGIKMRVYFLVTNSTNNLKMYPNTTNYTFVRDLPDYESDHNNPYRLKLDDSVIDQVGRYVFGILQIDDVGNITLETNRTLRNYTLYNMATSCRFWNETTEKWETAGCRVSSETSREMVVCLCNHLTSFGADFLVAPNPIDFSRLGEKLDIAKNPAVLSTIICVFALYVIGLVGCRRQDKKDLSKWSVSLLVDNNMCDHYFYQVTIQTGGKREAETSSRVFFMISGDIGETKLRLLADKEKTVFGRGSTRKFLMAVDKPLGVLSFLKIWHDNSGKKSMASWYLDHVIVSDLRTKTRYYFFCNDWLAVDQSDGLVERILPVATDNQLGSFKRVFASSTKRDFSDGHLWFSLTGNENTVMSDLISRPTKSSFTRVQRLTCALAILFSTMLTSAMFFGRDEGGTSQGILEIGPIKITLQQLMVSVQAAFIVLPVNILLVQLFRRAKPKGDDNEKMGIMSLLTKSVESIDNELDAKDGKEMNVGLQLPHWAVYVAWCLAAVVSLVSATFIFLYSIEWGATKSNEWLLSIFLSFFQSIFVIQPAKVIIAAILFSFFINRCQKGKAEEIIGENEEAQGANCDDFEEFKKKEEEWLLQTPKDDHLADLESRKCTVSKHELETARQERLRQRIMVNTIHDVLLYLLYVVLLITAANSSKDPQAFRFHSSLADVFLANGDPVFEQIRTPKDFWNWCDNGLIPGLHATSLYSNRRITWMESRFISNRATFVAGPARIRQLRFKQGPCIISNEPSAPSLAPRDCISTYSVLSQETRDFSPNWSDETQNTSSSTSPWVFQSSGDLGGFPYYGLRNIYDGGGYSVTLGNTAKSSRAKLATLEAENWINRHTAAVFIEFTVYNANVNLFGSVVLLLERSPNGAFFGFPVISPLRLYEFIDGKGYFLFPIYIIFVLVLTYNLQAIIRQIISEKKKYFQNFWKFVDFIIATMSLVAIAIYAVRFVHANLTLSKITADVDKETFVNFQYIVLWNDTFRFLLAFTVFLATVKFSKLLHFNRRIRLLALTLKHAAKPVLYFTSMFSIYFVAFMFLAHIWFEQKLYTHSTWYLTAEELFSMLLGRFDFTQLQSADQLLGPLFFIAFTGSLTITILNMFICILDESIKKARAELENEHNEFEVVDYMVKQLSSTLYASLPKFIKNTAKTEENALDDLPIYIEFPEDVLKLRIDELESHVTKMEKEFYASVTLEELEAELEDENQLFYDIV